MRNIIHILLFVTLSIWLAGCEKDTGENVPEPRLKVTGVNIVFEASGGEGYINVEAPEAVTAESDQDWCVVSVKDKTIQLQVASNKVLKGRAATITIRSASESTTVTAVQECAVFYLKDFKEDITVLSEKSMYKSAVVSSFPFEVASKPDWITYSVENDSLTLTALAGGPRKGKMILKSAGLEIELNILQISYVGFLGEWEMKYTNVYTNKKETETVRIIEKVKDKTLTLDGMVITGTHIAKIELTFLPASNDVLVNAGQYMATIEKKYVYFCLESQLGRLTWVKTIQMLGKYNLSDDGVVTYTFVDNGTWRNSVAEGFNFTVFTKQPPSVANYGGVTYRVLTNIVLTKK